MSTCVVIRPGDTDFNEESRLQGALDLPLNEHGQRQLEEIIEKVRDLDLDAIYTSSAEPALTTAQAICEGLDLPLKELEGLANVDQGLWQGMLIDEIRRKHPRTYKQWQEVPDSICPPEGETCDEVVVRVQKALKKPLRKQYDFGVVVSEPLATLVASLLRGQKPCLGGPESCGTARRLVEVIHPDHPDEEPEAAGLTLSAKAPAIGGTHR